MAIKIEHPADCEVRGVIRFLQAKGLRPVDIFRDITEVYGDVINPRNVANWCKRFCDGRTDVHDENRSGRPSIVTVDLIQKVDEIVRSDRRITLQQLQKNFPDVSKTTLNHIVSEDLGYIKISSRWVPRLLPVVHKQKRTVRAKLFVATYHEFGYALVNELDIYVFQSQLASLRHEEVSVRNLANIAKPAELPELNPIASKPANPALKRMLPIIGKRKITIKKPLMVSAHF